MEPLITPILDFVWPSPWVSKPGCGEPRVLHLPFPPIGCTLQACTQQACLPDIPPASSRGQATVVILTWQFLDSTHIYLTPCLNHLVWSSKISMSFKSLCVVHFFKPCNKFSLITITDQYCLDINDQYWLSGMVCLQKHYILELIVLNISQCKLWELCWYMTSGGSRISYGGGGLRSDATFRKISIKKRKNWDSRGGDQRNPLWMIRKRWLLLVCGGGSRISHRGCQASSRCQLLSQLHFIKFVGETKESGPLGGGGGRGWGCWHVSLGPPMMTIVAGGAYVKKYCCSTAHFHRCLHAEKVGHLKPHACFF